MTGSWITGDNPDPNSSQVMKNGSDVAIAACGTIVYTAMCGVEMLHEHDVSARLINVPCLKPLDETALQELCKGVHAILAAEEHSFVCGLSSAVCWALRRNRILMEAVAITDVFGQSAHDSKTLLTQYGLVEDNIEAAAFRVLKDAM